MSTTELIKRLKQNFDDFAHTIEGTELTNYNIEHKELEGERPIAQEHVKHNTAVRKVMLDAGIGKTILHYKITAKLGEPACYRW